MNKETELNLTNSTVCINKRRYSNNNSLINNNKNLLNQQTINKVLIIFNS